VETKDRKEDGTASDALLTHRDSVYRYVLSVVRDPSAAEDLTQETLLRAHRNLPSLEDPVRLAPWLYRIATNLCHDRFRQASSRHPSIPWDGETEPAATGTAAPRLDKVLEQKEMSSCVQAYLAELSDSYRAVILLHDVEGLANPEIAAMLGVSLATVKIRLHRARARLRGKLAKACSFTTDERGVFVCDPKPNDPGD